MATNTKHHGRRGAIKGRSQFQNVFTRLWSKRRTSTGRIMDVKTSGGKFKGVRREQVLRSKQRAK